ncbi:remorin 4.1-like [Cynara cardunculus var. scolymus]|uniref:Remorin, C-terminal n=1 Tax=Cynara cardunculus var. scolymus TaxID=59895 RepID=A0A103YN51_CYNCS|nr:remorin 4.1-like [Cynara cardunculus var. scolymus]KVI12082.1 Remorin, C-terminal [Cynara cardunculus var. scolymus]
MSSYQVVASTSSEDQNPDENVIRDIHALTPSSVSVLPPPTHHPLGSSVSMVTSDHGAFRDDFSSANSTLVVAGSVIGSTGVENDNREEYEVDLHNRSVLSPARNGREVSVPVRSVKKEEVESKIMAWKNAKIAEIMNRFKCEDAIIKGWENEQVQKANLKMKKVERKLEEKKVRAMEKMENEIAKAHQKAEERRASAESIKGTKMARVLEVANLMKVVGRSPVKNFF